MMSYTMDRVDIFWKIAQEETPELLAAIKQLENVNIRDAQGTSFLHVAAINHRLRIIKLLLKKGADPNCRDSRGMTPVLFALGRRNDTNPEILEMFLEYGLNLDMIQGDITIREHILSFGKPEYNEIIEKFEGREAGKY